MSKQDDHEANKAESLADLEPNGEVVGGTLSKVGPGTLVLTNANTYTGATTVNSGATLQVQDSLTLSEELL